MTEEASSTYDTNIIMASGNSNTILTKISFYRTTLTLCFYELTLPSIVNTVQNLYYLMDVDYRLQSMLHDFILNYKWTTNSFVSNVLK